MSFTFPRRPILRSEPTEEKREDWTSPQTLELFIERAWLSLPRAGTPLAPAVVYLTPRNLIVGGKQVVAGLGTVVGWYDQRITLKDFREDVFDVYEKRRAT